MTTRLLTAFIGILLPLIFIGCEKKPTACLNLPETLEAGTRLNLASCSEDFEFLTWEFSDGVGVEGDIAQRSFEQEGRFTIRLTAYANGAYRSDQTTQECATSFRYIERFEIIGNSQYDTLEIHYGNNLIFKVGDADGSFDEDTPLIKQVDAYTHIMSAEPTSINLFGISFTGGLIPLVSDKFNFEAVKDNPTVVASDQSNLEVKLYWTYRPL